MNFGDWAQVLMRGSAADRANLLAAARAGGAVPALTATPAVLAMEQTARDTGTAAGYAAATAAGNAAAEQAAMAGSMGGLAGQILADHHGAIADASAMRSSIEAVRPNCFITINTATPTVAIASGAATGVLTATIPNDTAIILFSFTPEDAADFLLTSLQVNGWECNKGGFGANLANYVGSVRRDNAPAPLVGRMWDGTITVSCNLTNTNAASKIFHGLTLHCLNADCISGLKRSQPMPGFLSWDRIQQAAGGIMASLGLR